MDRPQREEWANAATHGLGTLLAVIGCSTLLPHAWQNSGAEMLVASAIYSVSLIAVYLFSCLSHCVRNEHQRLFRKLDQATIYLLIAASYTPLSVAFLHHTWWWVLLSIIWILALFGFTSKILFAHRLQNVDIWVYLALGWLPVLGGMPLSPDVPFTCLAWFLAGGFFYTSGTWFLFNDRKHWTFHSIWHLFVIAGSASHFIMTWIANSAMVTP